MGRHCKKQQHFKSAVAVIESLAQDGRGVAHIDGKAVFIHGALTGERVQFQYKRIHQRFDEGVVEKILKSSPERVTPKCSHFGVCGGCSLQHMQASAQIRAKEQVLRDALQHIGQVQPQAGYLPPLVANHWGYRHKARLGVKYVMRKERLLVGFREHHSAFVADINSCEVLHSRIGKKITDLATTLASLSIYKQVPQVEIAMGDDVCVLVLRVLVRPDPNDQLKLRQFARVHNFHIYLQTGGPEQIEPLDTLVDLSYSIPDLGLVLHFQPLDFTQIHLELNRLMISRVLELLDPQPNTRILDLFCGIGNFTLPLATYSHTVVGVEGEARLVAKAKENAIANRLPHCQFFATDLYTDSLMATPWLQQTFDQVVLDPPRSGAAQVLAQLPQLGAKKILYISCLPATLARDAGILVHKHGYTLCVAGVMDMFPHTNHVESMALFVRN
ncbi:23S rRNA methyltransferase [Achromatium sp. WMS1]|nr:23S rRNA methyltransferase [Achromatium sp. WMS1]